MYKRVRIVLIVSCAVLLCLLTGCAVTEIDGSNDITVGGNIYFNALPLSEVEVQKNGLSFDIPLFTDSDGAFLLSGLRSGDKLSFIKEGFVIDDYLVKSSVSYLMIIALRPKYTISTSFDSQKGSVTGGAEYELGATVTLFAEPASGYKFEGFFEGDKLLSSDASYTFTATAAMTVTARFSAQSFEVAFLDVPADAEARGNGQYEFGQTVQISAKSNSLWRFDGWELWDKTMIVNEEYSFEMPAQSVTITPLFTRRLSAAVLSESGGVLKVECDTDAQIVEFFIDGQSAGEFIPENGILQIDLYNFLFSSKNYELSCESRGAGYADSVSSSLKVDYTRPIDAPQCGVVIGDGQDYLQIKRVLAASDYLIKINEKTFLISEISESDAVIGDGYITVNIDALIDEIGTYTIAVQCVADDIAKNSRWSKGVTYTRKGDLSAPEVVLNGSVLSWSCENSDAKFSLTLNGVNIDITGVAFVNIADYAEGGQTVSYVVTVFMAGYNSASVSGVYTP